MGHLLQSIEEANKAREEEMLQNQQNEENKEEQNEHAENEEHSEDKNANLEQMKDALKLQIEKNKK